MTILIFSAFYYPEGAENGYVNSIRSVAGYWRDWGNKVLIFTCGVRVKRLLVEELEGMTILRVPCWNPGWLNNSFPIPRPLAAIKALYYLRGCKIDIISTQTRFFITSWLGLFFGFIKKIPVVHTERGSCHTVSDNWLVSVAGWLVDQTLGCLVFRLADAVVGVSEAAAGFAKNLGAKNPKVINNGVDFSFWGSGSGRGLNSGAVTFVGRMIYGKGVQDLLEAALKVKDKDFSLNVIGDGVYKDELEKMARKLELVAKVKFWGELSHEQIKKVFEETAIFVNPSYSEGLPSSVLEAAAAGLPIVATNVGGTREIILDGDHGILIEAGDVEGMALAINSLLDDGKKREEMGQKVRNYIRRSFDWKAISMQYIDLFNNVSR